MANGTATTTSAWTPPAALTGFSATVNEAQSYIALHWDISTLVGDFNHYQVYRRLTGATTWTPFASITTQANSYFYDYLAGQGVSYEYYVSQFKTVPGDTALESGSSGSLNVSLATDTWFLIGADRSVSHIFSLPVTSEQHTQPIQQEIFEPLGTQRKTIARGNVLGFEGYIKVSWLDTERVTALAQVAYIVNNAGPHLLKSPFGDVWQVEFVSGGSSGGGSLSFTYLPGGNIEVSLSWIEVTF